MVSNDDYNRDYECIILLVLILYKFTQFIILFFSLTNFSIYLIVTDL